jgi:uncharacterized membrane-anchored protein YhcB (DUF1043 family)
MSLEKKWWVFIFLGIVIGLGIIFWRSLNKKIDNQKVVSERGMANTSMEVVVDNKKLVKVDTQVRAEVVSWQGKTGELVFKLSESGEVEKTTVDSSKMSLFIPEAQHKTNAVLPLTNKDKNWETAFCPQDTLTVGYDSGGEVKLLFNTGYRMCGFKGE